MTTMGPEARVNALKLQFGAGRGAGAPAAFYVGLCVGNPLLTGEEALSAGGYGRPSISNDAAMWGNVTNWLISNKLAVAFPASTAAWTSPSGGVLFNWWGFWDAANSGILWYSGRLAQPMQVGAAGITPQIGVGEITLVQGA